MGDPENVSMQNARENGKEPVYGEKVVRKVTISDHFWTHF